MTKKSKAVLREEYIKQFYLEKGRIPFPSHVAEKFKISERQASRHIRAVIDSIKDPELVEKIRRKFLEQLQQRIPAMDDKDFVKLTKHFLAEKAEVKADVDTTFNLIVPFRPSQEQHDEDANSQN